MSPQSVADSHYRLAVITPPESMDIISDKWEFKLYDNGTLVKDYLGWAWSYVTPPPFPLASVFANAVTVVNEWHINLSQPNFRAGGYIDNPSASSGSSDFADWDQITGTWTVNGTDPFGHPATWVSSGGTLIYPNGRISLPFADSTSASLDFDMRWESTNANIESPVTVGAEMVFSAGAGGTPGFAAATFFKDWQPLPGGFAFVGFSYQTALLNLPGTRYQAQSLSGPSTPWFTVGAEATYIGRQTITIDPVQWNDDFSYRIANGAW